MDVSKDPYIELVKRLCGKMSRGKEGYILWNETCFPFGSVLQIARQLVALRKRMAI